MKKILVLFLLFCWTSVACLVDRVLSAESNEDADDEYVLDVGLLIECDDAVSCGIPSWRGFVALENRYFVHHGTYKGQDQQNDVAFIVNPEFSYSWPSGNIVTIEPYLLLDSMDKERTEFDLREAYGLMLWEDWEFGLGARTIFWGVTESRQLVDIVNQKDYLANLDGTEKFGQPMVSAAGNTNIGNFELYLMPFFREQTSPGVDGRLRSPLLVDSDQSRYESGAEEYHLDVAARYSQFIGDWEFGLSYFSGTSRDPELVPGLQDGVTPVLIPYYEQINQAGLDVQVLAGEWLLKWESIYRDKESDDFIAFTTGVELTFTGILDTVVDCTVVAEWLYDDRGIRARTPYENDIMLGFRFAFNDISGSEIKLGVTKDINDSPAVYKFNAERRITDYWKVQLEGYVFSEAEQIDAIYFFRNDDYVSLTLMYYF